MSIQVVTDEKGKKTAVIVPIHDWEEIQKKLNTEIFYEEFASSVKEIKKDVEGNINLKSLKDLLNGH